MPVLVNILTYRSPKFAASADDQALLIIRAGFSRFALQFQAILCSLRGF